MEKRRKFKYLYHKKKNMKKIERENLKKENK